MAKVIVIKDINDLTQVAGKLDLTRTKLRDKLNSFRGFAPMGNKSTYPPVDVVELIDFCDKCSEEIQQLRRDIADEEHRRKEETIAQEFERIAMNIQVMGLLEESPTV